jgi:hypothetical protein
VDGHAEDGQAFRILRDPAAFARKKVTDNGTHLLKMYVRPFVKHGVDCFSEICDLKWGQDWIGWAVGATVNLAQAGITEVVVWCDEEGNPSKVAELR